MFIGAPSPPVVGAPTTAAPPSLTHFFPIGDDSSTATAADSASFPSLNGSGSLHAAAASISATASLFALFMADSLLGGCQSSGRASARGAREEAVWGIQTTDSMALLERPLSRDGCGEAALP